MKFKAFKKWAVDIARSQNIWVDVYNDRMDGKFIARFNDEDFTTCSVPYTGNRITVSYGKREAPNTGWNHVIEVIPDVAFN